MYMTFQGPISSWKGCRAMFNNKQKGKSTFTHFCSNSMWRLPIVTLCIVLLFLTVSLAYAANWGVYTTGNCYDGPEGSYQLWWAGYPSSSWGKTWGHLWYWNGSTWVEKAGCYGEDSGETGDAWCMANALSKSGSWDPTANYLSNFGVDTGDWGDIFTCP